MTEFGYAGKILTIDLSDGSTATLQTADYAGRFLGGRGIAAKLYWDLVPPQTGALDPDNCLICVTGPVAGFTRLAGCRWQICAKSPAMDPEAFSYANLGDRWGSWLKYAGYDGLAVRGKGEKPVYLYLTGELNYFITGLGHGMKRRKLFPEGRQIISIPFDLLPSLLKTLKDMPWVLPAYKPDGLEFVRRLLDKLGIA